MLVLSIELATAFTERYGEIINAFDPDNPDVLEKEFVSAVTILAAFTHAQQELGSPDNLAYKRLAALYKAVSTEPSKIVSDPDRLRVSELTMQLLIGVRDLQISNGSSPTELSQAVDMVMAGQAGQDVMEFMTGPGRYDQTFEQTAQEISALVAEAILVLPHGLFLQSSFLHTILINTDHVADDPSDSATIGYSSRLRYYKKVLEQKMATSTLPEASDVAFVLGQAIDWVMQVVYSCIRHIYLMLNPNPFLDGNPTLFFEQEVRRLEERVAELDRSKGVKLQTHLELLRLVKDSANQWLLAVKDTTGIIRALAAVDIAAVDRKQHQGYLAVAVVTLHILAANISHTDSNPILLEALRGLSHEVRSWPWEQLHQSGESVDYTNYITLIQS